MSEPSPSTHPATSTATSTSTAAAAATGGGLPQLLGRLGLYAVYVTTAVVVVVIAADVDVLAFHPRVAGLLALIVAGGPLVGMLLGTFASYVNYYGTWRILRRLDEYDAGQDLKSHAADLPQAVQAALAGRSGCLPAGSAALLLASLVLAGAANVPPSTPGIGPLGSWQHQGGGRGVAAATPTPKVVILETVTAEPTATATAVPTATATATARPTAAPQPTATGTPNPVQFTVYPLTYAYTTCLNNPLGAPAVTVTLDNTKSTVAVSWTGTVVETDGAGNAWATLLDPATGGQVTGGTVQAGKTQTISVTPNPASPRGELCSSSPPPGKTWHVTIATPNAGTFTFAYTAS